jgi:cytoskeleton protein RodZ
MTEMAGERVSSVGEHLRRQRQMRGISLDEIVAITKISRRHLQALEDEQFDQLPGGIFNRSYVRAYAKCVGIDEEQAVAEYQEAAREKAPDTRVIAQQHASLHSDRPRERTGFPLMPVLVLLVVVAGGVGGWKVYQHRQREKAQAATSASSAEVHEAPVNSNSSPPAVQTLSSPLRPTPEASSPASAAPQAAAASSQLPAAPAPTPTSLNTADQTAVALPFELTVRPKDQAWVSVKADGRYLVRGIIAPPAVKTIHASTEIIFYTGNAGAVEVAFNGKGVPLTAGPNQPQTLVFNSHGAQPKGPAQ